MQTKASNVSPEWSKDLGRFYVFDSLSFANWFNDIFMKFDERKSQCLIIDYLPKLTEFVLFYPLLFTYENLGKV